ncbi:AB hydrolase superfamily protein YdjP [Jannaschia seosinensis]|uniref:AB hydrolase superfamily protein YdjP n=1 Tax=Jannaschia seosinensis TaxID=313367 RepID=A0A0M7BC69_9RHOB|nr:alpha/beta hydrolase [Jannaschia seosinensis]CUH38866.1 AB hydrolase superfamily protein YdjP [Jannaschia seosinensis]
MNSLPTRAAIAALVLAAMPAQAQTQTQIPSVSDLPAPSEREGMTLERAGAEIFFNVSGPDDGEGTDTIVLLHGYPLSGALFSRVVGTLDDTHRVVTIDHRGYGNSTIPYPVAAPGVYAEDALAVLDEIGVDEAFVGGMSMGGPIMFRMYEIRPDLFRGMIAIDTNHMAAGPIERGIWRGAEDALLTEEDVSAIIPFLIPNMLTGRARTGDEAVAEDYLTTVMEQASLDGAIGGARALANRPDFTETLRDSDVPLLAIVGLEDTVYPVAISQVMVDLVANGEIAVIDGASHAAVFEEAEAVVSVMTDWMENIE